MSRTYSTLSCFDGSYATASVNIEGIRKWGLIDKGGKAGLITAYGERITPFKYDLILPIRRNDELYFALIKPSGSGVIDSKGNFVLEPIYGGIGVNCSNDKDAWIVVNKGNETFYIDKQWKRCCL